VAARGDNDEDGVVGGPGGAALGIGGGVEEEKEGVVDTFTPLIKL